MKILNLSQLPNRTISTKSFIRKSADLDLRKNLDEVGGDVKSESVIREASLVKSIRDIVDFDGDLKKTTISSFKDNGYIRINGEYSKNFVDYRTVDISNVKVVDGTTFKFLLSIKKTDDDSNPTLYTSKEFYDSLAYTYSQNNPYIVEAATKQEAIVVIVLDTLVQKAESLHHNELNATADNGVLVTKNLFVFSNFDLDGEAGVTEYKNAKSRPTHNIEDIVKYIDWVVSKPNSNYEDRLIRANKIGRWKFDTSTGDFFDSIVPNADEIPNNLNNPTTFPPFGRPGDYQNEISTDDNDIDWKWNINTQQWEEQPQSNLPESTPSANPYIGATAPGGGYGGNTNTTSDDNTGGGGIRGDS
jgi:hypothetical protein